MVLLPHLRRFVFFAVAWLAATVCHAANPAHLAEFPSVDRVLAEIKGPDPRSTQAKQIGALTQLWHMVASLAQGRSETADETRLRQAYNVALGRINQPVIASFDGVESQRLGLHSPRAKWVALCSLYEHDEGLRDELLQRFFSEPFRARFTAAIRDGHRVVKHSPAELAQNEAGTAPQWLEELPWYKGPAWALLVLTGGYAFWVFHYFKGELKGFGLVPGNTRLLRAGRRLYTLEAVTGILVEEKKVTLTKATTRTFRDPDSLMGETSTTLVQMKKVHRFNVGTPDGKKTLVWLDHHQAKVSSGQRVSVIKVAPRKKESVDFLLYVDHDGGIRSQDTKRTAKIFRPRYTLPFGLTGLAICLGLYGEAIRGYAGNEANFPTWFDFTGSVANRFQEVILSWSSNYVFFWVGALILFWVATMILAGLRSRRFLRHGSNPLMDELAAEAKRQEADGFVEAMIPVKPSNELL